MSTKLALIDFVQGCIGVIKGGETVVKCLVDLSKEFDCVDINILI